MGRASSKIFCKRVAPLDALPMAADQNDVSRFVEQYPLDVTETSEFSLPRFRHRSLNIGAVLIPGGV